ncbi:YeeE/YedE family protein [Nesterenkonia pannonica]|uniref:YeeE/YedE family protein n=1 Tax=Nesterenkonia pannonica TaxID=1548602 RepID=UPI0021644156|nr:YeeE/YedE family protein [Nesterenkonia pannonica]
MYAILVSIAVGMIGYAIIFSTRVPDPQSSTVPTDAHIAPVSLALVIAGVAFGVGMVISGAASQATSTASRRGICARSRPWRV